MNKEKIIRMAREAAFSEPAHPFITWDASDEQLERFAALVAEHEREACAAICDRFQARDVGMQPAECAGAIRARGNT